MTYRNRKILVGFWGLKSNEDMSTEKENSNFKAFLSYRGRNMDILTYDGQSLIEYLKDRIMSSFAKHSNEPGAFHIYFDKSDIDPNEASMELLTDFTGDFIEDEPNNFCLKEFEIFKERYSNLPNGINSSDFFRLVYFEPNETMKSWCKTHFGEVSGGFDLFFFNKKVGMNEGLYEFEEHKDIGKRRINEIAYALFKKYRKMPDVTNSIYIHCDDRTFIEEVSSLKKNIESIDLRVNVHPIFKLNSDTRGNTNREKKYIEGYMVENAELIIGLFFNEEMHDINYVFNNFDPEIASNIFVFTREKNLKKLLIDLNMLKDNKNLTIDFVYKYLKESDIPTLKDIQNRLKN